MLSDPIRIADAINNPKFRVGDEVVLAEGPHKYVHGIFLRLKDDVEWAAIKEANGAVSSHPVEWMRSYRGPDSGTAKTAMKTNQLVDNTATAKTTMIEADQFSPTADAIAVLAYRYWTERDRSNGSPEEDWLRAENEIKHNRTPGSVV
jgi:DUF2934 family protein